MYSGHTIHGREKEQERKYMISEQEAEKRERERDRKERQTYLAVVDSCGENSNLFVKSQVQRKNRLVCM